MATPNQIADALRAVERRMTPRGMVKAGVVLRESEGKFILEMIEAARKLIESDRAA